MSVSIIPSFAPVIPEIALALFAMVALMAGVFGKKEGTNIISLFSLVSLVITLALLLVIPKGRIEAFDGLFIADAFAVYLKLLVLSGSFFVLMMSRRSLAAEEITQFEYPILVLLATLGMMIMISANNLLTVFVGLELQSLSLYVMTAMRRDHIKASEAAMKYFVLGALSTGLLLYGVSLVYGFAGSTSFATIQKIFASTQDISIGVMVGVGLVIVALAFKISIVPFHMWTPDVYEGAPTSVTTFLASTPKIAAFGLITRVLIVPFLPLLTKWQGILMVLSIASMIWGSFAGLAQVDIKRLLAYSSIANMGYALIGLVVGTADGVQSSLIYITLYLVMTAAAFGTLLFITRKGHEITLIDDIKGLVRIHPVIAAILAFVLFSMAGIPPLAGFLGKLYVFKAAISAQLYTLAIIGVLTSVVSAAYYLKIIKVMFMDEPQTKRIQILAEAKGDTPLGMVLAISIAFLIWFFVKPTPVITFANIAAVSLF
jgi:NADH-quinone oxidoreductase subunit N